MYRMPFNNCKWKLLIIHLMVVLKMQSEGLPLDETCKNGGRLNVVFWHHLPYITVATNGSVSGLFPNLLERMVDRCCQAKVQFTYRQAKGPADFYSPIQDLKFNRTPASFDLAMPLHTTQYGRTSFETLPFLAIAESLGVAVLKHSNVSSNKLLISLFQAWPILIFILLTAATAGIVIWFVERQGNSEQFSPIFLHGALDGFWWAFVSMTSVGYGDKYPKSILGRILGSSWIVLGMLFVTMFIGTLTTTLMTLFMEGTYNIRDEKISVVNGSEAYWLGISQQASTKVVQEQKDLFLPLINYEVDAALVDMNSLKDVVPDLQKKHNIRVSGIILTETFYGIVLRHSSTNLTTCFKTFLEDGEDSIYQTLADYSGTQKNDLDPAEDYFGSGGVFSISVYSMVTLFVTLCIIRILWEVYKVRRVKHPKKDKAEEEESTCQVRDSPLTGRVALAIMSSSSDGLQYACQCKSNNVESRMSHAVLKQSEV